MQSILNFVGHFWWLVFPLSGVVGGWARAWTRAGERRYQRKLELYKVKNQAQRVEQVRADEVGQLMTTHDGVNKRWLAYELDVGKLIDFPMMTDVREPLTVAFLRAKREADGLRPGSPEEITAKGRLDEYRAAVNGYEVAFEVAEREARRVRDSSFTGPERQRLATARKLITIAVDDAATPAERQTAYRRARRELDGLIVLPDATVASLEEKVARMLGTGKAQ
ncbi:hypothetical protein [Arthrobacter sp. A5]|uniref:hypothetical protein n=1 Tax=Arthrobacter sp. A5 TaxID=576926 RepID=UPI003DA99799